MRALLLCAALLLATPACAENIDPNVKESPKPWVVPIMLECDTLDQLHSIIKAAIHLGQEGSMAVYVHLNAGHKKPVCRNFPMSLRDKNKMKPLEAYHAIETVPGHLRDVVVLSFKKSKHTVHYIAIERQIGMGYTI